MGLHRQALPETFLEFRGSTKGLRGPNEVHRDKGPRRFLRDSGELSTVDIENSLPLKVTFSKISEKGDSRETIEGGKQGVFCGNLGHHHELAGWAGGAASEQVAKSELHWYFRHCPSSARVDFAPLAVNSGRADRGVDLGRWVLMWSREGSKVVEPASSNLSPVQGAR